ncbi:MAG: outer membrane beta-barrel protein, partial [Gemmatimonadota bacterium]
MKRALIPGAVLALAAAILLAAGAAAQQGPPVTSDPTGFHLAGYLNGSAIEYEGDNETESGGGIALALGWGVNRRVTIYLRGSAAEVDMAGLNDTYALAHFDIAARVHFRGPEAQVLPFVMGGVSGRAAQIDLLGDPFSITGAGPTLGGGVAIFLNPSLAIDIGLSWTAGTFTQAEYRGLTEEIDISATSARFEAGVAWWA